MKFKSQQPTSFHSPKCRSKGKSCSRKYQNDACDKLGHESSKKVPSILFKRASRHSSSILKSYAGKTGYVEIVEIKGKRQQKHHAIACPGKVLIERRKDVSGPRGRSFNTCPRPESSEASDSSNDACSVGSCSLNSWRQDGFFESNLLYSDAESIYPSGDKEEEEEEDRDYCSKEKVEVSVHSLELHAYRCTLQALFVSGPLSWEQEELLTNLRITLHISNDEHLKLLRDLISSATSK